MALFSERYGYTKPSDVIIREQITPDIQNAILSCYDRLKERIENSYEYKWIYTNIEKFIWTRFLNQRESTFSWYSSSSAIAQYIEENNDWYKKLDLIEMTIKYIHTIIELYQNDEIRQLLENFIEDVNREFKRLNFGYRIINGQIVEITSEEEITTIEKALESNQSNIRTHLSKALELYARKPTGDYRNSIKESISAVEAMSQNITGENTLNFKKMEEKGVTIPSILRQAFEKLYGYTNDKSTGIRHALMEDTNTPQAEEALFMLVSCSAFINYLNKKVY